MQRREFIARSTLLGVATAMGLRAAGQAAEEKSDEKWGDLVGRLVYDGAPPERAKLKVDKDVECCGKFDIRDESLMVGPDGGLANAFIYVRTPKVEICPELAEKAEKQVLLDNRDCIFKPHCTTIWCEKQEFCIVNSDPVAQNVAFSPLGDTPANIVLAVDGKATHKFSRKQSVPVPIACNYHPWESGYVLPRDNPYAAVTQADGTFRIGRLPVARSNSRRGRSGSAFSTPRNGPRGDSRCRSSRARTTWARSRSPPRSW